MNLLHKSIHGSLGNRHRSLGLLLALLALFVTLGTSTASWADPVRCGRGGYESSSWQRIHHGVRSGRLTYPEAKRLAYGQHRLNRMEQRFRADGYLSHPERQHLRTAWNRQNARIYRQKNDRQFRRYW
ncbi:MAG: hypothetical protein SFZ03_11890 [Candidatus Melainabacteria bacterium]|nr:hypothetical protein [Candidatus Melainabacteria bacterium]